MYRPDQMHVSANTKAVQCRNTEKMSYRQMRPDAPPLFTCYGIVGLYFLMTTYPGLDAHIVSEALSPDQYH